MKVVALALASVLMVGCSSTTVPDMTYYRLPEPVLPATAELHIGVPIDVAVFAADGLYAEQALIYTLDAEGRALRSYHYQHWSDPPSRMLQRRLIRILRELGAAPLVTDRLPASADALRLSGVIQRYDRVQLGGGYQVEVALQVRAEHAGNLLSEKVYKATVPADGKEMSATIAAFGVAVDQVNAELIAHLASLKVGR